MNQNFTGAPDREDIRILDQLRRQMLSMIAVMDKLKLEMEFRMSRGEAVDWPQVHRTTTLVSTYLSSFSSLIHGGYKHSSETVKETRQVQKQDENGNLLSNGDGTPVLVTKEVPKVIYRDTPFDGHAERIEALHPFPMPPFPITGVGANMINTMLRKRLEPKEEEWVEERLRKASEFAHVPSEWNIEPKKPDAQEEEKEDDDAEEADDADQLSTKRVKGTLTEDSLLDLWKFAHQEAFDQQYLKAKYPDAFGGEGEAEGAEEEDESGDDDDDDEDDDDFEDVMDISDDPVVPAVTKEPEKAAAQVSEPTSKPTRAAVSFVHPPVPGLPVLALGVVHRFMSCGEV